MEGEILEHTNGNYYCAGSDGYGHMANHHNNSKTGGDKLIIITANPDQLSRLQAKSNLYLSKLHTSAAGRNKTIRINQELKQAQRKGAAGATNTDDPQRKNHNISIATI